LSENQNIYKFQGFGNKFFNKEKPVVQLEGKIKNDDGTFAVRLTSKEIFYCYQSYYTGAIQYGTYGTKADFISTYHLET
jgi:hypothetical protein